jgi:hypothetical protein
VECWLETFGDDLEPQLLAFESERDVVGCCLLIWRTKWSYGLPIRRVYLNCAGENETDEVGAEFNSLLAIPGYADAVAKTLFAYLKDRRWDEFILAGMVGKESDDPNGLALGNKEEKKTPAYYIDFSAVREGKSGFLGTLGASTRHHIRRAQKSYEEQNGPCMAQFAETVEEALAMLDELAQLHQARWQSRGKPGCFSSRKFTSFHRTLIRRAFGRTLLFRLKAGEQVVGVLYCFVYQGWVYDYQSGFSYTLDGRRSPGLFTISQLVSSCLPRKELKGLSLMAGNSEYKRSITSGSNQETMRWIVFRRFGARNSLFQLLRSLKRRYVQTREQNGKPR